MAIEISVTLTDDNSAEILKELGPAAEKAFEMIGLQGEGYAKRLCPVDTGRLRNSITHEKDSEAAYIGTNVEYAAYVEYGTSKTKEQPYLRPAAEDHADEYMEIFRECLSDA